jgi:hypothetical protein
MTTGPLALFGQLATGAASLDGCFLELLQWAARDTRPTEFGVKARAIVPAEVSGLLGMTATLLHNVKQPNTYSNTQHNTFPRRVCARALISCHPVRGGRSADRRPVLARHQCRGAVS